MTEIPYITPLIKMMMTAFVSVSSDVSRLKVEQKEFKENYIVRF